MKQDLLKIRRRDYKKEQNMPEFTLKKTLLLACCSEALYRDVARNWKGLALRYLLLLTFLCLSILSVFLLRGFLFASEETFSAIAHKVPRMELRDGELFFHEKEPFAWTPPGELSPRLIIDTTGALTSLEGSNAQILITKTGIHARQQSGETRFVPFAKEISLEINPENVQDWLRSLRLIVLCIFIPLLIIVVFIFDFIVAILYALLALLLQPLFGLSLAFEQLIRLSIVASTPKELFYVLCAVLGLHIPYPVLLGTGITLMYLLFALRASATNAGAIEK